MSQIEKWNALKCEKGEVALMWMGQAGFLVKNSLNKVMAIDLYLSDLAMRLDGNKRLTPAAAKADEINADVILVSHSHTDHLDLDSLPVLLSGADKLYCSKACYPLSEKAGLPVQRLHKEVI